MSKGNADVSPPRITIIEKGDNVTIIQPNVNETILESLESNGISILYQCRDGYCGACQAELIDGQVAYREDPIAYKPNGSFLPCCSFPLGDISVKLA